MTDKDSRRVEEEKATLKAIFTYRSLQHDIELVLEDTERAMFADANRRGQPLYGIASKFVLDCYYERGALEPLVKAYSSQPYRVASRFDRLLRHLADAQRVDLIERFWTSIARVTRAEFLYQRPRRDYGDAAGAQEFKNYALEAYARGIECLTKLGRSDVADGLTRERTALLEERFRSLSPPSDLRRVDASVFWELISTTRSRSSTTIEQLAALGGSLLALKGTEIKRFGLLYVKFMRRLHHWNVWALAYAARGGCSDGAFEAFRTWLILQGDPALLDLCVTDPTQAAERVTPHPDLPDGPCLMTIEEAYFHRRGAPLALPPIDLKSPRGVEWTEEAFATRYPELLRRYAPPGGPVHFP